MPPPARAGGDGAGPDAGLRKGVIAMRKILLTTCVILAAFALIAGCGAKTEQAMESSSDSLLAANPSEPPPGDITPQTQYQQPSEPAQTPPPATAPTHKPKPQPRTETPR